MGMCALTVCPATCYMLFLPIQIHCSGAPPGNREEVSLGQLDTPPHLGGDWAEIIASELEDQIPPGQPLVDPSVLKE